MRFADAPTNYQVALLLEKLAIPTKLLLQHSVPANQYMQAVVLSEADQHLCAIFPRGHILDLRSLNNCLQADYKANSAHAISLKNTLQVDKLPAIPAMLGLPCVYAQPASEPQEVFIESGTAGHLLQISGQDFMQLLQNSQALHFTSPVPANNPNLQSAHKDAHAITQAVQSLTTLRIKKRLEETLEIPPLPATAQKTLKLRTNPDAHIDELSSIIETDPAMSAQVISWATSSYYSTPGKVRSIEDAIMRVLGFDLVINLALGLALNKSLRPPANSSRQNVKHWQKAIYTASLVEGLVLAMPREHRPEPGLAYLAGLLHNFGYMLLAHVFPPHLSLLNQYLAANPHLKPYQIEHYLLGITSEQIGAWLLQHWQVPPELFTAIRHQHNPAYEGPHAIYSQLVFLATRLLENQPGEQVPEALYQSLHLHEADALQALDKVRTAEQALRALAGQLSG